MQQNPYFALWVANTIEQLGGIGAVYLQGLEREWSLTFAQTRMDARQLPPVGYFDDDSKFDRALKRLTRLGATNLYTLH